MRGRRLIKSAVSGTSIFAEADADNLHANEKRSTDTILRDAKGMRA
jgi:hypothetical protein